MNQNAPNSPNATTDDVIDIPPILPPLPRIPEIPQNKRKRQPKEIGPFVETIISTCYCYSYLVVIIGMIFLPCYYFFPPGRNLALNDDNVLGYIGYSLDMHPIKEVTLVSYPNKQCPPDFEFIHLGRWPGIGIGCGCSDGASYRPKGGCRDGCSSIDEMGFKDMLFWEESLFCVKRAQIEIDYIKKAQCPSGFKQCTPGICMKDSLDCPVTSISFTSNPSLTAIGQLKTSGRYVSIERTMGEPPLVDLDISMNGIPCLSLNHIPRGGGNYLLLKKKPDGCSKYGHDWSYSFRIDHKTEKQTFIDNHFPDKVIMLPHYPLDRTVNFLVGKKKIMWTNKDTCWNIDTSGLRNLDHPLNKLKVLLIIFVSLGIPFILFESFFIIGLTDSRTGKTGERKFTLNYFRNPTSVPETILFGFFCLLRAIFFIAVISVASSYYSTVYQTKDSLDQLVENNCLPEGQITTVVTDSINYLNRGLLTMFWLSVLMTAIPLVSQGSVILLFVYKKLKQR